MQQYGEGSARLVAMDRHSGRVLWSRDAVYRFRHNSIVAHDEMVFCLDYRPAPRPQRGHG